MNQNELADSQYFATYKRLPLNIVLADGCYLQDVDGNKYLDFFCGIGVNALGHGNEKIKESILKQTEKYIHLSNLFSQESQNNLADEILRITNYEKLFFTNSGTESTEGAIKLAKKWGKLNNKTEIFGMTNGFSGRSMGALSLMDKEKYISGYEPFLPNFNRIIFNDVDSLNEKINDKTCAVFLEFLQGEGGILPASKDFVDKLFDLREKYGFLIVADEIQSGVGRTGKFFAFEHYSVQPDIVTMAKAIGGGLPLGVILGNKKVSEVWTHGTHGTTFGGNPVCCAAGFALLNEMKNKNIIENVFRNSIKVFDKLNQLKIKYKTIKEIRGIGYMIGIEINCDNAEIVSKMREKGVLILATGTNVLRILPPLIATENEFEIFYKTFEDVLTEIEK